MAKREPKTWLGTVRKGLTGDGRKNLDTLAREQLSVKKKKKG